MRGLVAKILFQHCHYCEQSLNETVAKQGLPILLTSLRLDQFPGAGPMHSGVQILSIFIITLKRNSIKKSPLSYV